MTGQPGLRTRSAGFDTNWTPIPRERLHPKDLWHMIDWVREGWDEDELFVTPRLQRLKWHLDELPYPYASLALKPYSTLCRARIVADEPWEAALSQLGRIVSDWANDIRERRRRT